MKIIQIKCDHCCKPIEKFVSFRKFLKSNMDPSGNGYNDEYDYFDICHYCLIDFIKISLTSPVNNLEVVNN